MQLLLLLDLHAAKTTHPFAGAVPATAFSCAVDGLVMRYRHTFSLLLLLSAAAAPAQQGPELLPYPQTSTPLPVALPPAETMLAPPAESLIVPAEAPVVTESPLVEEVIVSPEAGPVYYWYQPAYWFTDDGWDSGLELGLNGSSGTSESTSLRAGGYMKRATDTHKFETELYHNRTSAGGLETQNNAMFKARRDWLLGESPWSIYALTNVFYDEFQAFDVNVNINAGFGYQWIETERTQLSTSLGSGASREFGGTDDRWIPEAQLGFAYEYKWSDAHKIYAKMDYFPQWESWSAYRLLTDVGWEIALPTPSNLSLKIAATDRYDSEPDGADPHNLNYSVLLLWKL